MPVFRLLAAVLMAIFSFSVALAEAQKRPIDSCSIVVMPESNTKASSGTSSDISTFLKDKNSNFDSTCYTMRTYMLKKDAPGSDSVHPVGYTTCQPAFQYEMKVTRKPTEPALIW
jgi:hypothetical protein